MATNGNVQLMLGRLLHASEESQKALDRLEARELENVQANAQLQTEVERLQEDVAGLARILRGKNGHGIISKTEQLDERVKVLYRYKHGNKKLLAFIASPGLLALLDRVLAWVNQ